MMVDRALGSDDLVITFDLLYSEAKKLPEGTWVIEVDHFPFDMKDVIALPGKVLELRIKAVAGEDKGRCKFYITDSSLFVKSEDRWLYSYRNKAFHRSLS
jgi:hypothetical protein